MPKPCIVTENYSCNAGMASTSGTSYYYVIVAWKCKVCRTAEYLVHNTYPATGRSLPHQQQLANILLMAT